MDSIDKILDQLLVSGVELGKSILTVLALRENLNVLYKLLKNH